MNRRTSILIFLFSFGLSHGLHAQTSTWPLADNIHLSGVQFYMGVNQGLSKGNWNKDYLLNHTSISFSEQAKNEIAASPEDFRRESNFSYSIGLVFHPFTTNESEFIRALEWVLSIDFRQTSYKLLTYPAITNSQLVQVKHRHPYRIENRSVLLSNQMNWTKKWGRFKLHTGPTIGLSLSPGVKIISEEYMRQGGDVSDKPTEPVTLASSKFFLAFQYRIGFQYNINCRFNAFVESMYSWSKPKMSDGNLSGQYLGINLGVKYKFQKPTGPNQGHDKDLFW